MADKLNKNSKKLVDRVVVFLKGFDTGYWRGFFVSFILGFVVRAVPEILSFPYPLGFDTVYYAARISSGTIWYQWTSALSSWLLYAILVPVYKLTRVDPFLLLKLAGPVLYALNACGIYYFSRKALGWNMRKALIAAFFFVFQLAAFRISWDLLRNTLGLALLLFAAPSVQNIKTKRTLVWFALLSILVVFSSEHASVVMFVGVFWVLASDLLEGNKTKSLKVLAAVTPALITFLMVVYFMIFPIPFHMKPSALSGDQPVTHPYGLFFLTNYFIGSGSGQYSTYFDLTSHFLSLFAVLYVLCLPLISVGFFRNRILNGWTSFLVVASFSCLATPFFALDLWDRWMFMLVYPITFYAVNGIQKVFDSHRCLHPTWKWLEWVKLSREATFALLFSMVLLTSFYMATTLQSDNYVIFSIPTISRYFSVAPTVPLRDVEGTVQALEWINNHMNNASSLLVHQAFLSWARLILDEKCTLFYYVRDVEEALNAAMRHGFDPIYLIWWNENIGWYGASVPTSFEASFDSGRISVFRYCIAGKS